MEDVLVKVDKLIFPTDFIILDIEEEEDVPIILGHLFLAMSRALIDVQQGKLTLRLDKKEVVFRVFNSLKHPSTLNTCHSISTVNSLVSLNSISMQEIYIEGTVRKKSTTTSTTKSPEKRKDNPFKRGKEFFKDTG